jgi:nicotinamide-nucleotide amidase
MNAEIIAVGSELLLGQIVNTNAQFISRQLSELGVNVYYHTVVGDNPERLVRAIKVAEERADVIIFSGGLGPTKDDLTKEMIAKHLGLKLVYDAHAMQTIEAFFAKRSRPMTDNNRKQALVLDGCTVLANRHGLAPGMLYDSGNRTYILLPGPPKELEPMFQFEAKPLLARRLGHSAVIESHVLRFYGIGEAELEVRIADILDNQTNPTVAPLASDGEVTLRITAKAEDISVARAFINHKVDEIMAIVGEYCYGTNDDSLASSAVDMMKRNGLTIAAAESLTAGLLQSELANIAGVSSVLIGGVVTYTEVAKTEQLGVATSLIHDHGVVSEAVAIDMALRVKEKFGTDIGVGLTGAAGPEPHGDQPAGTVWIGLAIGDHPPVSYRLQLNSSRNINRLRAVKFAFHYIVKQLKQLGYR